MRRLGLAIASLGTLVLSACAINGARSFVPAALNPGVHNGATTVTVKVTVATASPATARGPRPRYFSASSKGLLVQAFEHGKTKVLAQTAVSIVAGAKACGGKKTTPRTCSATVSLFPGTKVDFVIADYDAPPASGKIPKSAHPLGYGRLNDKNIATASAKNSFSVYLGGVIAGLSGNAGFVSMPGDGSSHMLLLVIHPTDFGNNPIAAGKNDPFANPIKVSLAETGGTGHAALLLNGGGAATSVSVTKSSDTVQLDYDGGGTFGYGAVVTLSAPQVKSFGGATETIDVSPLLAASTSADYAAGLLSLKGNGDEVTLQAGELNAPATTAYAVAAANCLGIANNTTMSQTSGASGTFSVFAQALPSTPPPGTGCGFTISDGTSSIDVSVKNSYSGMLGTPAITNIPIPTASSGADGIHVGPDGNMWVAERLAQKIAKLPATGKSPTVTEYPLPAASISPNPFEIAAGSDGQMWWTGALNGSIGKITTGGTSTVYPQSATNTTPLGIAGGADGALWFAQCTGNAIGKITTAGTITTYPLANGSLPGLIALGPDGNMWFTECGTNKIGKITPDGTLTEFSVPTANAALDGITAGPDGAMWFTEETQNKIGRIPITATVANPNVTEYPVLTAASFPNAITTGPDGALWFTEVCAGQIGRLDPTQASPGTSNGMTEYLLNPGVRPIDITSGPDGAIWFTEPNVGEVGRVAIQTSAMLHYRNSPRVGTRGGGSLRMRLHHDDTLRIVEHVIELP